MYIERCVMQVGKKSSRDGSRVVCKALFEMNLLLVNRAVSFCTPVLLCIWFGMFYMYTRRPRPYDHYYFSFSFFRPLPSSPAAFFRFFEIRKKKSFHCKPDGKHNRCHLLKTTRRVKSKKEEGVGTRN